MDNGFQLEKIVVIPNMIDPKLVSNDRIKSANITTLLYAGAIKKPKGVEYLVKSLVYLPDNVCLRIAGTGDQLGEIKSLVEEHELNSRIEFVGWLDHEEISDFYSSGDIFVHPGVWPEPFGRTLLEAMQHSLPVVATRVGGNPEIIQQSKLLCRSESPAALAIAIKYARKNRTKYGKENVEYARRLYHPKEIIPKYKSVYKEIV